MITSRWNWMLRVGCCATGMLLCATPLLRGATGTWTNTAPGTVANWTDAVNWNGASYPGSGAGETASLTVTTVSVYKAVLNAALPNPLSTLAISNNAVGGTAWVIVTNAALSGATLTIGTGGGLEIDSGGLVSNTFAATLTGVGGQVLVANGGTVSSIGISNIANNTSIQVLTGGVWNLQNGILHVGNGGITARTNSIVVNGGMLTNVGSVNLGDGYTFGAAHQNTLVVTNGGLLFTGPALLGAKTSSNTVTVAGNGSLWNGGGGSLQIGQKGGTFDAVLVSGGGCVTNMGAIEIGTSTSTGTYSNNLVVTDGGGLFSGTVSIGSGQNPPSWTAYSNRYAIGGSGAPCTVSNGLITVGHSGGYNSMTIGNASLTSPGVLIGENSRGNSVTVQSGATWNFQGKTLTWGSGAGATNNQLWIASDAQLTNVGSVSIGDSGASLTLGRQELSAGTGLNIGTVAGQGGNSLTISNQAYTASASTTIGAAGSCGNSLSVGANVSWLGGQALTIGSSGGTGNAVLFDGGTTGSTLSNGAVTVGSGGDSNALTITNAVTMRCSSSLTIGSGGSSNHLVVAGANARLIWPVYDKAFSIGSTGTGNWTVIDGGLLTNTGVLVIGGVGSALNSLTITNGGQLWFGDTSGGGTPGYVGQSNAVDNVMVVTAGAAASNLKGGYTFHVGYGPLGARNALTIRNGGYFRNNGSTLSVGTLGATSNTISVLDGGIFEGYALTTGSGAGNIITNNGGIYQFAASPTLTPGTPGSIAINSGTVSFRGFSTADVLCNQSGKPLDSATKMSWSGTNAFRLDNATNATSGQTYTFGPGMGATNFVRLELVNGSTYRGGAVTFASGGSLLVSTGVSAVSNITFQSGSSLGITLGTTNNDTQLRLLGNASLGGTLAVTFATKPGPGDTFTVVNKSSPGGFSGSFATVQAFWQGAPYQIVVSYPNSTAVVIRATAGLQGTAVLFR